MVKYELVKGKKLKDKRKEAVKQNEAVGKEEGLMVEEEVLVEEELVVEEEVLLLAVDKQVEHWSRMDLDLVGVGTVGQEEVLVVVVAVVEQL